MGKLNVDLIRFISCVRDSHPDIVELYTKGQCYMFAHQLRLFCKGGELHYDHIEGHVYYYLNSVWYDIRGAHYKKPNCNYMTHRDGHPPHRWGKGDRRRLILEK